MQRQTSARTIRGAALLLLGGFFLGSPPAAAQPQVGEVVWSRWMEVEGFPYFQEGCDSGMPGLQFGTAIASLGDLDGDGNGDVVVGDPMRHFDFFKDYLKYAVGGLWILFLSSDGSVEGYQEIGYQAGGFTGSPGNHGSFGAAVTALGDVDGDGVVDLAVGEPYDDDGGTAQGAVWILFLRPDGTVKSHHKITALDGDLSLVLENCAHFGSSLATLGDLDGDGVPDLAVGAPRPTYAGGPCGHSRPGSVHVLLLTREGGVKSSIELGGVESPLVEVVEGGDRFGGALAALGDLDGDGNPELAVGADLDDDGGTDTGAVWVLFLERDGTLKAYNKISATTGGFAGPLPSGSRFGRALALLPDLHGGGLPALAASAPRAGGDASAFAGAVFLLTLAPDGTVAEHVELSAEKGGFTGWPNCGGFGNSLACLGDVDGEGAVDLAVGGAGSEYAPDGYNEYFDGLWLLFLNDGTVSAPRKIREGLAGFSGPVPNDAVFGRGVAALSDLDGSSATALAVGAPGHIGPNGGPNMGALWVFFLSGSGSVQGQQRIGSGSGGFTGSLGTKDRFGEALAFLSDLDGDGVLDLAVGAPGDKDGSMGGGLTSPPITDRGSVWMLFLRADGTVKAHQKISAEEGGLAIPLPVEGRFGGALAWLGDLDGDGVGDLAVGAPGDPGGLGAGSKVGAVWILFLRPDGTPKGLQYIGRNRGGFTGELEALDRFGSALACLGDLDGDGLPELAVGAPFDDDSGADRGAVWVLFLRSDGSVKTHAKLAAERGGFPGSLADGDRFGAALARLEDLDGDELPELAVGATGDDGGGVDSGAAWLLHLRADGTLKPRHEKITAKSTLFPQPLDAGDGFGSALAFLGNFDGDGRPHLAVGTPGDDDLGAERGALWLLTPVVSPWIELGQGLAGSQGVPSLSGKGSLEPGTLTKWTLEGALADAPTTLVVGLAELALPFAGGVMVPQPDVLLTGLVTDGEGRHVLSARWPEDVPPGTILFYQHWIVDPAGAQGLAASTALWSATP